MDNSKMKRSFTWLLFGELTNDRGTSLDWEPFLSSTLDDIERVLRQIGRPLDVLFFAGDLVPAGQAHEYEKTSHIFQVLFDRLRKLDFRPAVFCVPGNHDIERSSETQRLADTEMQMWREFFPNAARILHPAFGPYTSWTKRWVSPRVRRGLFPGDILSDGDGVGIVGLNTALNQGGVAPSPPPILIDERRLDELCDGSLERWADQHRLRLLLTHHPPSLFEPHIGPESRIGRSFHLHLCSSSRGGFQWPEVRKNQPVVIQAPRFNPTRTGESGYVAGVIDLDKASTAWLWFRESTPDRSEWHPVHELDEVFTVDLPSSRQASIKSSTPPPEFSTEEPIYIDKLTLSGFRSFDTLELHFRRPSTLIGEWTCVAGINGAGKTSILQALCLALLGDPLVRELGGERLNRMRRLEKGQRVDARIELELQATTSNRAIRAHLDILENGDIRASAEPYGFWQHLRTRVVVAYGATRNLSSRTESGNENLSADVRRQATLFDPLSQLANAEVLLKQQGATGLVLPLFQNVVREVFDADLLVDTTGGVVRFTVANKDNVEAIDLPDGFRATAAWLADLCAIWCDKSPTRAVSARPQDISAIVLIDEIDAHLHPALQRKLVPKLRAAMPNVQWIVTTHSPLVLSNFDRNEIIALDRDREGNIRPIDRQILGFSSDQIYEWLMGTPPTGEAMEQVLEQNERTGKPSDDEVAELLTTSGHIDGEQARAKVERLKDTIERLKP
jgi:predicted ATPase